MDITPEIEAGRKLVNGYGDGGFRISGTRHEGSVLVLPTLVTALAVTTVAEITEESVAPVLAADSGVEILLIGCGREMALVPESLRAVLRGAGVAVEPMDTGAACRTYNVLLAEDRRVAALLIAVD